jgi:predicted DsbA family dithiol-disulfide isomerase
MDRRSFSGVVSLTTRAHRLSRKAYLAGGQYKQLPILNAIFKAYTVEQKDIGDLELLAQFSEDVGLMSKEEVRVLRLYPD